MSSGCGDVLTLEDLKTAKKHQTFEAEVITGMAGGIAGGASIDYATNQVTGQTQKTMPAILRDLGFIAVSWDFSTGGTLTISDRDKTVYDPVSKTWYTYKGTLPVTVPAGYNPVGSADWSPITDPTLRDELYALFGSGDFSAEALYKYRKPAAIAGTVLRTYQSRFDDFVTVKDFGAVGDGVTNDTAAVQAAINSGAREIRYTDGDYLVDAASLTCVSNQSHVGYGATLKHTSTTLGYSIFNAFEKVNLKFIGLRFEGPSSVTNAINCVSCNTVLVSGCTTSNIGLFSCKSRKSPNPYVAHDNTGAYPLVTDSADYNYFITIEGCRTSGDGTGTLGGAFKVAGIHLSYFRFATVTGCNINGHKEGIQWLGGDANSSAGNGAYSNARKCSDLTVTACDVIDTVGGIWGSMGARVTVSGNAVRDCKDVGIDFEGCFDSTASGNTVANCTNGCLTAIFTNRNIVFSGNTVSSSAGNDTVIAAVINSLADTNNLSVSFIGNNFSNDSFVSMLKVEGVQNIVIENNFFNNVYVNTADYASGNTRRYENISGNTMWFTGGGAGYSYAALTVGNTTISGTSRICGNLISGLSVATNQYGIFAKETKTTSNAQQMLIQGNTVRGFINDLLVNAVVPTSSRHLYSIQGNLFSTGGTNIAANSANIVQANNYKPDASAISF